MDISRRQLAVVLTGAAASQAQTPQAVPADADVEEAQRRQRIAAQAIARVKLPMTTEPAFQFKA
jgi:hypothetical protein